MSSKQSLTVNASLSMVKQVCAILFPMLSFSYAMHILGKEAIGMYSFSSSIVSYFALTAALGISTYAVREGAAIRENPNKLKQFINQVFTINLVMTSVSILLLLVAAVISERLQAYRIIIIIQSSTILLSTLGADWINTIFEDYKYLAIRYIVIQVFTLLLLYVCVKSDEDFYLYVVITILSSSGGNILNWFYIRKKIRFRIVKQMHFKEHIKPMLILFANNAASTIYLNSDITMLGLMTNDGIVGIYTIAARIYSLIKSIANSIVMVVLPRFSNMISQGKIEEYKKMISTLLAVMWFISVPMATGVIICAKSIIFVLAGKEFVAGTLALQLLGIAIPITCCSSVFVYAVLIPQRKEGTVLVATSIAAVVNLLANLVLIPLLTLYGAAITTLLAECIIFAYLLYYSLRTIEIHIEKNEVISVLIGCVGIVIICLAVKQLHMKALLELPVEIILSIIGYACIELKMKNKTMIDILFGVRKLVK